MIVMCPFFDDLEKLTNFKYTYPCVSRIGNLNSINFMELISIQINFCHYSQYFCIVITILIIFHFSLLYILLPCFLILIIYLHQLV